MRIVATTPKIPISTLTKNEFTSATWANAIVNYRVVLTNPVFYLDYMFFCGITCLKT